MEIVDDASVLCYIYPLQMKEIEDRDNNPTDHLPLIKRLALISSKRIPEVRHCLELCVHAMQ